MIFYALLNLAVGFVIGHLTTPGGQVAPGAPVVFAYQSPYTPPGYVFGIVWASLYVMTAYVMYASEMNPSIDARKRFGGLYFVQFMVQNSWPIVFFGLHRYGAALVILATLIVLVFQSLRFLPHDRLAGLFWRLYLLWLLFAICLNAHSVYLAHRAGESVFGTIGNPCIGTEIAKYLPQCVQRKE
jgi:tryptophan-rich sensory protein